jgi:hypothetical protein
MWRAEAPVDTGERERSRRPPQAARCCFDRRIETRLRRDDSSDTRAVDAEGDVSPLRHHWQRNIVAAGTRWFTSPHRAHDTEAA